MRTNSAVQLFEVDTAESVGAYAVENAYKLSVLLSVNLFQLDGNERHLLPHPRVEEIQRGVERLEKLAFVVLDDWF